MSEVIYRRRDGESTALGKEPGPVMHWRQDGGDRVEELHFRCPCGERIVHVSTVNGHGIKFDENGLVTIVGSCGSKEYPATEEHPPLESNACHFSVENGRVTMHGDSICPGNGGSMDNVPHPMRGKRLR